MISTSQTAQEQQSANLAALQQKLQELAASTRSTAKGPVVAHGSVLVIRGK